MELYSMKYRISNLKNDDNVYKSKREHLTRIQTAGDKRTFEISFIL